jgi:hypothetical protein
MRTLPHKCAFELGIGQSSLFFSFAFSSFGYIFSSSVLGFFPSSFLVERFLNVIDHLLLRFPCGIPSVSPLLSFSLSFSVFLLLLQQFYMTMFSSCVSCALLTEPGDYKDQRPPCLRCCRPPAVKEQKQRKKVKTVCINNGTVNPFAMPSDFSGR